MRNQQIFITSSNRDYGTPGDLVISFPNGLVKDPRPGITTTLELVEFSIPRLWYDVVEPLNNNFILYRNGIPITNFPISLPSGWYTFGGDNAGAGTDIAAALQLRLTAGEGGAWNVVVDNRTGCLVFVTPGTSGNSYGLDFLGSPRCAETLGFQNRTFSSKVTYPINGTVYTNELLMAARPFNINRTSQLVVHTDLKAAFPQATLDNFGPTFQPVLNSDVLAVIPVDQPPRGILNYQANEKINKVTIKEGELRSLRVFITDNKEAPMDLTNCEWTAVFRVLYGDNLSV